MEVHPVVDQEDVEDRRMQLFGFIRDLYVTWKEYDNPCVNPELFSDLNRSADKAKTIADVSVVEIEIEEIYEWIIEEDE